MRPLILGNGRILICQDERGTIRDIYFPYVGLENHGNSIKAGIYDLDRRVFSWFENWDIDQNYKTDFPVSFFTDRPSDEISPEMGPQQISNIGETTFNNDDLGIRVLILDAVHPSIPFLYRTIETENISSSTRNLRLFSNQNYMIGRYFSSLVAPAADYLASSLDRKTGLPKPSYDLWEERKGVHIYSACSVYAGLNGACLLARVLGDEDELGRWSEAADAVKKAIPELYDKNLGRFKRSTSDSSLDASIFAVWYLGVLAPDDDRVINSMRAVEKELTTPSGGIARYNGDNYQGYMNGWIICTLWLAQWHIAMGNLARALELIRWCAEHAAITGLMPEQVGDDGAPRSVLPLMWSHCTFVLAVMDYLAALTLEEMATLGRKGYPCNKSLLLQD